MKNMVDSFGETLRLIKADKVVLFFSFMPVLIGGALYYFLGHWLYMDVLLKGKDWIQSSLVEGSWGTVLYYLLFILLSIAFYLVVSWTFVLIVSFIASPFNDIISSRIERRIIGAPPESIGSSFLKMLKKIFHIIINESKKILFIGFMSIIAFAFSFVPILVPISVGLTALLLAASFLDYSWSRHELKFRSCLNDIKGSIVAYAFSGLIFMTLIAVPVLNLFVLPYAVVYYTILYVDKHHHHQIAESNAKNINQGPK